MVALLLTILITLLDQGTKYYVRSTMALEQSITMLPGFFTVTYVRNTGAAWGMFGGQNLSLTVFSLVMLVLMVIFHRTFLSDTLEHKIALGLLLGGIIGNLVDRVKLGWVTDFIDLSVRGHHWPTFNISDAAICAGVALYVVSSLWLSNHPLRDTGVKKVPAAGDQVDPLT